MTDPTSPEMVRLPYNTLYASKMELVVKPTLTYEATLEHIATIVIAMIKSRCE